MVRQEFLGVMFDDLTFSEAVSAAVSSPQSAFRYVVTPNVDHVVRLHNEVGADGKGKFKPLYDFADHCLCDSRVLARLARICRVRLTVVPGSDLTAAVLQKLDERNGAVAIIGGWPETVHRLERRFPSIRFRQHIPPMGLRDNPQALSDAVRFIRDAGADCTLLAVGSPQQEMLAARVKQEGGAKGVGLCIGASIDFLTGKETRAPIALQKAGLEWAYRLCNDPKRLWRRYLVDGPRIFLLARRWRRLRRVEGE